MIFGIILVLGLITFFMICIIIGGNKNKLEYESKIEEEEQIKYLRNYKEYVKNRKGKNGKNIYR